MPPSSRHGPQWGVLAVVAALALLLSGCSASAGSNGQAVVFGLSGEPQKIKAGADQGGTGYIMDTLVHQGLLTYDGTGAIAPGLAREHLRIDNSTYRFVLQPNLRFSDGTRLTSGDVAKTFAFYGDAANGARTVKGMSNIARVDTVDDSTLVVHLKTADPDFFEYVADPTAFIATPASLQAGATATVGAGPFEIRTEIDGVSTTLVRNPDYWGAAGVALQTIEVVYYADSNARTNALLGNDVDIIDYVAWEDFDRIRADRDLVLDSQPGSLMDVEFNADRGPFADPRVRRAVAYAVNRDDVARAAFSGFARPLYGVPLGEGSPFASAASEHMYRYDPAEAKRLLAEAGYANGFSATMLTTSQYAFYQDAALTMQADLAEIGIDLRIDSVDWATRNQKSKNGQYDVRIGGGGGVVTGPAYLDAWINGPVVARSYGYDNPALKTAFTQGRTAPDQASAKAAYDRAFSIIAEDVPMVNLVQRDQGLAWRSQLRGVSNLPGFLSFYSGYTLAGASLAGTGS